MAEKEVKKNKYNFVISTYWTPITGLCYYFINNFIGKNSKKIGLFHNLIPHEKFVFSELILKKFLKMLLMQCKEKEKLILQLIKMNLQFK